MASAEVHDACCGENRHTAAVVLYVAHGAGRLVKVQDYLGKDGVIIGSPLRIRREQEFRARHGRGHLGLDLSSWYPQQ